MLLIDNDTATRVLNMTDCIAALEEAYTEEAQRHGGKPDQVPDACSYE